MKTIWVPKSETYVVCKDGELKITEEMQFSVQPVKRPNGFEKRA